MSQRPSDPNRYRDFPKSYEDFQKSRAANNNRPIQPLPTTPDTFKRTPGSQSPRDQEIPVPILTKAQQEEYDRYRDTPPVTRKPIVQKSPNVDHSSLKSGIPTRSSASQERSVRESSASPARLRPEFKHEESFDEHTKKYTASRNSTPDRDRPSMSHSEWLNKKKQDKMGQKNNPNQDRINRDFEYGWKNTETINSVPPSPMTISHINQHHDLLRVDDLKAAPEMNLGSSEWLNNYSIEFLQLSLKDLLARGVVSKPVSDKTGKAVQHITFESLYVDEFEYKLNLALEMYSKRIKWLMQGSKKVFGLVQGERVAVVVDTSDASMGFGRAIEMQDALLSLIDEQLKKKKALYFLMYGTEASELWEETEVREVCHGTVEEAKIGVANMRPSGGSNLLKAMKKVAGLKEIDSILLVIGSVPDQSMDVIVDYMSQVLVHEACPLHCVSFEFSNHIVNSALKTLAEETNGRYHCYSRSQEEMAYNSTDVSLLLKEIQKTQDLLNRIKEMKQGMLGSAIVQIANEVSLEMEALESANYLPRPRGHDLPLNIEKQSATERSSLEWIDQHGLKSKKLNLYQVLAPNAYNPKQNYIPVLNKTVTSQIHSRAMVQFAWPDGSVKNLHVDLAELYDYQKKLRSVVELFEKRIDWLSTGSRKIFGSVAEDSVVILIDLAAANANYLIHIQHSLRLLLEQQMSNKKCFNLIAFGKSVKRWRPTVVRPTPILLQDAWKWVLGLRCSGTHNVLGAIRAALENEEERKHSIYVDGLYLFTSGMPDQPVETMCSYMEESACGRSLRIHTILFNVDDYDGNGPIAGRWANITNTAEALRSLAHSTPGGRFHWFRETGIIESDDIRRVQQEIDKTIDFSIKASALVDTVKQKTTTNHRRHYHSSDDNSDSERDHSNKQRPASAPRPCPPPRQTKSSLQRQKLQEDTSAAISPTTNKPGRLNTTSQKPPKTESFYVNNSTNGKGAVFRTYPANKSIRKSVPASITIPDREEPLSTKDWLKKYSLAKLKLDLHKLVSGPECKHNSVAIGTLKKDVTARYCAAFPSININGTVRHLQLKRDELKLYSSQCEKVLKRYAKRLQWLLSGSRRLFGTFTDERCAVLVDTSGSMDPFMAELRAELAALVWEQFHKNKVWFNFVRFSDRTEQWRETIVEPNEDNCHKAIAWLATLSAHGSTCTLEALNQAFNDDSISSICLISDGKPDSSTEMVLSEVRRMNARRGLKIDVVSFNCEDAAANEFMRKLAGENGGRYHRMSENDRQIQLFAHKIITEGVQDSFLAHIPEFEGDDLKRLAAEISKAKQFLGQSVNFAKLFDKKENFTDDMIVGPVYADEHYVQRELTPT